MGRNPSSEQGGRKKPPSGGGKSLDDFPGEMAYPPPGQSRFPSSVSKGLEEECSTRRKAYAMVYLDIHGHVKFDASPTIRFALQDIFTGEVCQRFVKAAAAARKGQGWRPAQSGTAQDLIQTIPEDNVVPPQSDRRSSDASSSVDVRRAPHKAAGRKQQGSPIPKSRHPKRRKSNAKDHGASQWGADSEDYSSDEGDFSEEGVMVESIKIGDTAVLDEYFDRQFKRIQQLNCKVIAKAWIKVVEPKKQSNHPYNGGKPDASGKADPEKTKPDWWPEGYRHKEPDHVKKNERVALLMHILRRLRDRGITYEQLQAATSDVESQLQAESRPMLTELYKVAKYEESYIRGEIDADTEVGVTVAERISMNGRGPKSSGDSEEVENPNISSPGIRIPHSSLQDTSTSSLISPVNHLALQDDRQYPRPDRPNVSARSDAANRTFMADEQHRPMLSDEYQPQYNHHNAANEIQTYIETQPSSEAPSLEYLSRNATHPFAPPSSEQMVLRDRGHYATLQQNQPPLTYPGWPPSTFNLQHFASPVNYSDNPTSTHSAHPSHSQPHYQLPPPANGIGALPPLHSHQPDSPFARVQPHYELRTGSQNNSHPHHHGMPHTEYTGFSFEDKPYGERS